MEEIMKRFSILVCILGLYFISTAWAQHPATKSPMGRHVPHRMAGQTSTTPDLTARRSFHAQANPGAATKIWELGTYPGGTWFASWHLNDLGVVVGRGDIPPDGYTHTLAVPLFGPHAGEWIDLGTLGGEQPKEWEEPFADISNTGLIVSQSTAKDGYEHAVAWTGETGLVDLGTLAATGDRRYASYKFSYSHGTNKLGTLIVGSGWNPETSRGWPAVWTPSFQWKDGKFVTKWKIQALDLSAFPELTGGGTWGVNDYGQIVGGGYNDDFTIFKALLWTPRAHGKGWEVTSLPPSAACPSNVAYGINEKGEIVGAVFSADYSCSVSLLWKPLDRERTRYSPPMNLPVPEGGFTSCENVGINNVGDMVGDCWNEDGSVNLPARWTKEDLTFSDVLNFPAVWGFGWGVNDFRIATVTYVSDLDGSCPYDTYGSCGGAIRLH
jgi:probable HAF family extracellular repeat protein